MSTYAANLAAWGRWPFVLIELETAKRCGNTRGIAPCLAAAGSDGARCYHNPFGCDSTAPSTDITPSTYTWRFTTAAAPIPRLILEQYSDIHPTVASVDSISQEIDLEAGFTAQEKVKISLHDLGGRETGGQSLPDCPPFDLDKSVRNTSRAGSFWRRWLAQWPNFRGMLVRVKLGFVTPSFPHTQLETRWIGKLEDVSIETNGMVALHAVSLMAALDRQVPPPISSSNVLQAGITRAATTLYVLDASEYTDPASIDGDVVVRVETFTGETEDMIVTARDTGANTLTVTRGAFNTNAEPCNVDAHVLEVFRVRDVRPMDYVIDVIQRTGLADAYVDSATMATEAQFIGPVTLERTQLEPKPAKELIFAALEPFQAFVYQDDDLLIKAAAFAPAMIGETVATITDTANIKFAPAPRMSMADNQRVTHCTVYHGLPEGDDSTDKADGIRIAINTDGFTAIMYGATKEDILGKRIIATCIRGDDQYSAELAAVRWAVTLGDAPKRFRWESELQDAGVKVGDLVDVTSADILDAHGTQVVTRFLIMKRTPVGLHSFTFEAMAVPFTAAKRWAFLGEAGAPDFGAASAAQKLRAYFGDANNLMSDASVGYVLP